MKRKLLVLFMIFSLMIPFVACQSENKGNENNQENNVVTNEQEVEEKEEAKGDYYPVTITTYNFQGEPVEYTFDKAPEKVVAVYQSSLENLLALGLGDKIICAAGLDVEVKDEWKDELAKVGKVETDSPSKEAVLEMEPDMICSWKSYFGEKKLGDVDFWHDRKIGTYIMLNSGIKQPNALEYEFEDILTLGKIFNKEMEAQEIVDNMKKDIEGAKEFAKDKDKIKTIIMEVEKENQYRNYGGDSIGGNIAQEVGADLVMPKNGSFGQEELVELNPEVIFTVYYGDEITPEEAVKGIVDNPALQSVDAVKNNRVYGMMLSEVYASGVRTADGIQSIVKGLYPEFSN
ncbi:MAG: ABC transporter substrate-binding protein [Tissierellia bacterium]|nr:ABC transporter substrate-binding protein [Tissierellia bacterium]